MNKTKTQQAEEVMNKIKDNIEESKSFIDDFDLSKLTATGKEKIIQELVTDYAYERLILEKERQTMLSCFKEEKEDVEKLKGCLRCVFCSDYIQVNADLLNDLSSAIKILENTK
jgi:hypothetical protein